MDLRQGRSPREARGNALGWRGTQTPREHQMFRLYSDFMDCSTPGFLVLHSLGACSDSCPLTWWCYLTISSGVAPFSSCLQSFLASGSFPMGRLFASGGQSIGALASVLPKYTQDWSTLGWTGLILQSKVLSRVFSSTTVQKHQLFSAQPSLWSSSHIHTWLLEKL